MYASLTDMQRRFGEAELLRLTDLMGVGQVDEAAVTVALTDASSLIDGYLAGRYGGIPFLSNLKDLHW